MLEISRSGYYDWLNHNPYAREQSNQTLKWKLIELHEKYPALGLAGIYSDRCRVYKITTNSWHHYPTTSNLLKRIIHIDISES